ncbi:MAG: selenium metabolism-associated LysR family transcriptional regulator [Planctomycetales bacterium]
MRHFHSFAAAAEHSNFTRAAETLNLTQAAVSQHVAALERELGVELFGREHRAVHLTDAGQKLYAQVQQILGLVEEIRREAGRATAVVRGTLSIAASTVPAECLLPELLSDFEKKFPEVRPLLSVSGSVQAAAAIESGKAEIGLVGELPRSSCLSAESVASDELVLIASPKHRLARREQVTVDDLRQESFVVREPGSGTRRCVEQTLEQARLLPSELSIAMETNSNEAIRAMVLQGAALAFQSRRAVARDLAEQRLITLPIEGVIMNRDLYVVVNPASHLTPPARAFVEFVKQWPTDA